MVNDNSRKFKQNQMMLCIQPWIVEFSVLIGVCEDRLRERGSLPATFFYQGNISSMANDNSRKFKQNQMMFCIQPWIVELSRSVDFGEVRVRERGSLPATFYVLTRVIFLMTNDNCHKFKRNQMMFCIQPCIVEFSIPIGVGEDRLRERGSLPATFYVLKGIFYGKR